MYVPVAEVTGYLSLFWAIDPRPRTANNPAMETPWAWIRHIITPQSARYEDRILKPISYRIPPGQRNVPPHYCTQSTRLNQRALPSPSPRLDESVVRPSIDMRAHNPVFVLKIVSCLFIYTVTFVAHKHTVQSQHTRGIRTTASSSSCLSTFQIKEAAP